MMRFRTLATWTGMWASLCMAAAAAEWGDLTGRFVYDGTPPAPEKLVINKDQEVFLNLGLVDESLAVHPQNRGIANVVVYVRTRGVAVHPDIVAKLPKTVSVDNKGGRFVPRITTLWLEHQELEVLNSDPVAHNANCQPLGDEGFNPLLPIKGKYIHAFNRAQLIPQPISCNIHAWMKGFVLPRDNPYATVTDADGRFKLEKLPAGVELEFQVWHERAGYLVAKPQWERGRFTMTLRPGANDLGDIVVSPNLFK